MKGISMKKFYSLFLAIFVAVSFTHPAWAGETSIIPSSGTEYPSFAIPIALATTSSATTGTYTSVTQQLYLASELTEAGVKANDSISGLTFYYEGKSNSAISSNVTRHLKIFITNSTLSADSFEIHTLTNDYGLSRYRYIFEDPGNICVCDKEVTATSVAAGKTGEWNIDFSTNFKWNGSSNIILTVFDVTNTAFDLLNFRFKIKSTDHSRFISNYWITSGTPNASSLVSSLGGAEGNLYPTSNSAMANQMSGHRYVTELKFSIVSPIPAPTGLSAGSISTNSATLSWGAVTGVTATGYNVKWGKTSGALDHSASVGSSTTSLSISGLDDGETYYFAVQTVTADGTSDFSGEANFTTTAIPHVHNEISFNKWTSTTTLPTSGNYYLANDVSMGWENADVTLTGNLNLCLNGKIADLGIYKIIVPDGYTLQIFDNEGNGKITSMFAGDIGTGIIYTGVITVLSGGTLILGEGAIENTFPADDEDGYKSIAIANNGTLKLSGAPVITSAEMDICLAPTIPAKVITIESGKPLTNSTPYKVYKSSSSVITSGWANMGGANPADFFSASDDSHAVILEDGEAKLVKVISLSDSQDNSSTITNGVNQGTPIMVVMTRSFTSASYNTICLPFNLTDAQLQEVFGSGYDLQAFQGADLDGETLLLSFSKVTSLTAGDPYLIQPSINVVNPTFNGVTIPSGLSATPAAVVTSLINFQGVYSPTDVGSGKNILFVGAKNELFWNNNASGELKGFRAFFTAKNGAAQAISARIVKKDNAATAIDNVQGDDIQCKKVLQNGQLLIQHNGTMYNVQGQMVK